MIRYASILDESVVDGPGIRVVVFLQGCSSRCQGCHNTDLLPMDGGIAVDEEQLGDLILKHLTPLHRGVTFSGGDPLAQPEALLRVVNYIRSKNHCMDIWVYSGFTYEQVQHLPVMKYIDVLVDGPFVLSQKNLQLPFRGSTNQRVIDVVKSLEKKEVVEYTGNRFKALDLINRPSVY